MNPLSQLVQVDGPLDRQTLNLVTIAAFRTKIHIHDTTPCVDCLSDLVYCGTHVLALTQRIEELERKLGGREKR